MEIQWADVLPPLSVIGTMLLMWWRLENKIEGVRQALDTKIDGVREGLDTKIEGVRSGSETAHRSIHDDLCDLKVTTTAIKTDVEWLKKDRQE